MIKQLIVGYRNDLKLKLKKYDKICRRQKQFCTKILIKLSLYLINISRHQTKWRIIYNCFKLGCKLAINWVISLFKRTNIFGSSCLTIKVFSSKQICINRHTLISLKIDCLFKYNIPSNHFLFSNLFHKFFWPIILLIYH